jgi:hypothetical protein
VLCVAQKGKLCILVWTGGKDGCNRPEETQMNLALTIPTSKGDIIS